MLSEKNLKELNLSEDQLQKYKDFERKEKVLKSSLKRCHVSNNAIDNIIAKSDLNKVDETNTEALEEEIRNLWKDFIYD